MALTVGSLFSGIGGIDLGLERAGMVTRWFVEWDAHCQNVLRRHWPGIPVYGDITAVDWGTVEPVDVLAGGFPCQPVSNAGKRLGTDDARWLWPEFARAIRTLEPRYVLVENVAALLGRGFEHVITDLAALGYDAEWDCIPAAAVGAPHLRDRLWTVAYARGEQHEGGSPAGRRSGAARLHGTVANTAGIAGRGGPGQMGQRTDPAGRGSTLADSHSSRQRSPFGDDDARQPDAARSRADVADPDSRRGDGPGEQRTQRRHEPEDRRQPLADTQGERLSDGHAVPCEPRPAQPQRLSGSGRAVQNAILAGLEGHERGVMALAHFRRSNADLAGPGWWSAEPDVGRVADGVPHRVDRLRALGNAVVPQVVEFIGRRIVAFDARRA